MLKSLAVVSAVTLGLTLPGFARAGAQSGQQSDQLSLAYQPVYLDDAPPAPAPEPAPKSTLNGALSNWGPTKSLQDNGFDFGGWIEGSYSYDTSDPSTGTIPFALFGTDNNQILMNQLELHVGRTIAPQKDKFDVGFFVDMMYGTDARYIHSNGLNWYGQSLHNFAPQTNPQYQVDLTQAYALFNVPVGNGLVVTVGKFVTLLGYETINPNTNPLFSHSYLFSFAIPFTNTGVLGTYAINDKVSITGGITRGWDQSTDDNNMSIDGIGQIKWVASDKLTVIVNGITGPEMFDNNHDYTTVIDGIATYALGDNITLGINGDWGFGEGTAANGGYGQWFGVAGYAGYKFDSHLTVNGRLEFFNDNDGCRGIGATVYEATLGAMVTPFPNERLASTFRVRPELRYDWSADPVYNGEDSQFVVAIDALWSF